MRAIPVAIIACFAAVFVLRSAQATESHWAFQPLTVPGVPDSSDAWVRSPIDAFVLEKLQAAGLFPSPQADRRTLLRRAHFGLSGLPPSYTELQSFEEDAAMGAFDRVIERLLASPAYGQHWARHWLDVARYADTKGYVFTANPYYPYAYTYRDYVIEAFNDDVPYDQFIVEQLAADLAPHPRNDRTLAALGFITVGRRFNNNTQDILDDRIDAITRGFLGLTVACARCHDHKYDPVPTADYYSLYGVLASCEEPGDLPYVGDPTQYAGYGRFQAELNRKRQAAEGYLSLQHGLLLADLRNRIGEYLKIIAERQAGAPAEKTPPQIKPQILERWERFLEEPVRAKDPAFSVWAALAKIPPDRFAADVDEQLAALIARACREADGSSNLLIAAALSCDKPQTLAAAAGSLERLFAAADSLWVALENPLLSAAQIPAPVVEQMEQALAAHGTAGETPEALRRRTIEHVLVDLKKLRQFLYSSDAPLAVTRDQVRRNLDVREKQKLERLFREADEFEAKSPDAPPRAMVVVDRPKPIEPRVFERGNPNRPGEQVPRQFLAALAEGKRQPFQRGSGRLELAREIASAANPLTARVIVNRVWQHHFGEGLVRSPSNFGTNGEVPSHPELLDWLASQFIERGWSLKWLHREIMRSSTYQQSSQLGGQGTVVRGRLSLVSSQLSVEKDALATDHGQLTTDTPPSIDPQNRLLWRQTRRRLDFEPLRDSLLAWSGRLDTAHGGQPFRLDEQPSIPRRTIYGLIDRQLMYEPLRYFDVASPDASASERPRTTVPQQSLFLLNSPFVAEQARALVKRIESESLAADQDKVIALYETVLLRAPAPDELASAAEFLGRSDTAGASANSDGHLTRLEQLAQTLMVCNEAVFVD